MTKPYHDYYQGETVRLYNGYRGVLEWYDHDMGKWVVSYNNFKRVGSFTEDEMEPTSNA